ncbi:transposable element Tcb1 transposase [Trichonephila clavipes]|nr:transposable element Tcb1 transposase [Trichonephila clavipes]
MFGSIVVNAHGQRAFVIVILAYHLARWYGVLLDTCLDHLLLGNLNCARYISGVLQPVALPFIQVLRNPTFKQDNTRSHVAGILWSFLGMENFRLLSWPACSPDDSPLENVCSMVAEPLARYHTPVTTVDERWYRVEAAWSCVPVHAIQSLFDSMARRKVLLLMPEVVVFGTDFSGFMHQIFGKLNLICYF